MTSTLFTRAARLGRIALGASLALAGGSALAHTGHGHDAFDAAHGLLHALTEPDHLAMLVAGAAICSVLAPRLLRAARRLRAAWRERARAARADIAGEVRR